MEKDFQYEYWKLKKENILTAKRLLDSQMLLLKYQESEADAEILLLEEKISQLKKVQNGDDSERTQ